MTDLRKAAEMALEALEEVKSFGFPTRWDGCFDEEIQALRQALAQEEKPPVKSYCGGKPNYCTPVDAINMSQERVDETAKGEHEPVVWVVQYKDHHEFVWGSKPEFRGGTVLAFQPLYMTPPKREWVGLTDEEVETIVNDNTHDECGYDIWCHGKGVARDIEAKLKEKNGG